MCTTTDYKYFEPSHICIAKYLNITITTMLATEYQKQIKHLRKSNELHNTHLILLNF